MAALLKKSSSRLSSLALPETTEAGNWQRPPWLRLEERTCACSAARLRGPAFICGPLPLYSCVSLVTGLAPDDGGQVRSVRARL